MERVARQVRFVGEERRRDDRSMKEVYVKLLSNASNQEFPDNTPNRFKNRLPFPIHLRKPGWKVGLVDVALPPGRPRLPADDPFLFRFAWTLLVDPQNDLYAREVQTIAAADIPYPCKTGTDLLTLVSHKYQWVLRNQSGTDLRFTEKGTDRKLYSTFRRVERGEFELNNDGMTLATPSRYPKVAIGKRLAEAMGWIRMGALQNGQPGYVLGFNLRKEFPGDRLTDATDLIQAQTNGDETLYEIDNDVLKLSCVCNWRFTNVDESFAAAFDTKHDTLYVYSNVGQSRVTGHHVTDLLRDVPYPLKDERSQTIQYLPVRNEVIDNVEVQVAGNGGALASFFPGGLTQFTLHLKYE